MSEQKQQFEILTVEEVAQYFRVSERTIYDWAQHNKIPCGKLGTTWRFKRSEIEEWANERLSHNKKPLAPSKAINIADTLKPDRIIFLNRTSKNEALEELISCLSSTPEIGDPKELREGIFRREELMSTGIGLGIGVPHVRLESVENVVMAIGLSQHGIVDYESLDGNPVHIICMVAGGKNQHTQYLLILAAISNEMKDPLFRESLLAVETSESAYEILTQQKRNT